MQDNQSLDETGSDLNAKQKQDTNISVENLKEKLQEIDEPDRPANLPSEAELNTEYQINQENAVGDIVDCDHRDDLEDVANHFFLNEKYWSVEKVWTWGGNGLGVIKREHRLVAQSQPRREYDFYTEGDDEHFARQEFPTEKGAALFAKQYDCYFERVEE